MAQKRKKAGTRLTGRIVLPGNPSYNAARMEFNRRFSKFPRVIVFCRRTQDVINAIKWARERVYGCECVAGGTAMKAFLL